MLILWHVLLCRPRRAPPTWASSVTPACLSHATASLSQALRQTSKVRAYEFETVEISSPIAVDAAASLVGVSAVGAVLMDVRIVAHIHSGATPIIC